MTVTVRSYTGGLMFVKNSLIVNRIKFKSVQMY